MGYLEQRGDKVLAVTLSAELVGMCTPKAVHHWGRLAAAVLLLPEARVSSASRWQQNQSVSVVIKTATLGPAYC